MRFDPQAGVTKAEATKSTRRRSGRLPQDTLLSNLGEVLDISAGGMRVICRSVPRSKIQIQLEGHNLPGPLFAELAWSKRAGFWKREVGLRFIDVSPEVAHCLTSIAALNRFRRAM